MDPLLKRTLRAQTSVAELLQSPPLADKMEEIVSAAAAPAAKSAAGGNKASAKPVAAINEPEEPVDPAEFAAPHQIAMQVNLGNNKAADDTTAKFKSLKPDAKSKITDLEQESLRIVDIGCQLLTEKPWGG